MKNPSLEGGGPGLPGSEGVARTGLHPQSLRDSPLKGAVFKAGAENETDLGSPTLRNARTWEILRLATLAQDDILDRVIIGT